MKQILTLIIVLFANSIMFAQTKGLTNSGATIKTSTGASVRVVGIGGDVVNKNGGAINVKGNMYIAGNLNNTATFNNEGSVVTLKTLVAPAAVNIGGLGLELSTGSTLNNLTLTWFGAAQTGKLNGANSIRSYYRLALADYAVNNATLAFRYTDADLNGLIESDLILWASADGDTWTQLGGTLDASIKTVTLNGINTLANYYTLASVQPSGEPQVLPTKATGEGDKNAVAQVTTTVNTIAKSVSLEKDKLLQVKPLEVSLFPNPSDNLPVTVRLENTVAGSEAQIKIFDAQGKEIMATKITCLDTTTDFEFNTNDFGKGVYFIRIKTNEVEKSKILILQ